MKKMDRKKAQEAMHGAVLKTFSDMAFIDAEDYTEAMDDLKYSQIIHISFSEPQIGHLALFLPYDCKKMIVENIYGKDWKQLPDKAIDDCLLEILNVLAGSFLRNYYGNDVKQTLSFPELLFDEDELAINQAAMEFFFDAEGYPFKVTAYLDG